MYDLLGPVLINGFFFSINLMSVHNSAKFQHCGVIFVKSAVDIKKPHIFPLPRTFFCGHCNTLGVTGVFILYVKANTLKAVFRIRKIFNTDPYRILGSIF
jgi:hypothetical protein